MHCRNGFLIFTIKIHFHIWDWCWSPTVKRKSSVHWGIAVPPHRTVVPCRASINGWQEEGVDPRRESRAQVLREEENSVFKMDWKWLDDRWDINLRTDRVKLSF